MAHRQATTMESEAGAGDSVLFFVDGSLDPDGGNEVTSGALRAVRDVVRNLLIQGPTRFRFSVLLVNTDSETPKRVSTSNKRRQSSAESRKDVTILLPFNASTEDLLNFLKNKNTPFVSRKRYMSIEDGLVEANHQFRAIDSSNRRLVFIAPNEDLNQFEMFFKSCLWELIKIQVQIVPLLVSVNSARTTTSPFWEKLYKKHAFYNIDSTGPHGTSQVDIGGKKAEACASEVAMRPVQVNTSDPDWKEKLVLKLKSKSERKITCFRARLLIGKLKIGISGCQVITDPHAYRKLSIRSISGHSTAMNVEVSQKQVSELQDLLIQDFDEIFVESFRHVSNLPEFLSNATSTFITSSNFEIPSSNKMFASLHRTMRKSRKVAEVVFYRQQNLAMRGILMAFNPWSDEKGNVGPNTKCGMYFVPIPTFDELAILPEPSRLSDVQKVVPFMRGILKKLWVPNFSPTQVPNPIYGYMSQVMRGSNMRNSLPESSYEKITQILSQLDSSIVDGFTVLKSPLLSPAYNGLTDTTRHLPHYIPRFLRNWLSKTTLSIHDLELLIIFLFGKNVWNHVFQKIIADNVNSEAIIKSWLLNTVEQCGLDKIVLSYSVPQTIHWSVYASLRHHRLAQIPQVYKLLTCMMYEKRIISSLKADEMLASIFGRKRKLSRDHKPSKKLHRNQTMPIRNTKLESSEENLSVSYTDPADELLASKNNSVHEIVSSASGEDLPSLGRLVGGREIVFRNSTASEQEETHTQSLINKRVSSDSGSLPSPVRSRQASTDNGSVGRVPSRSQPSVVELGGSRNCSNLGNVQPQSINGTRVGGTNPSQHSQNNRVVVPLSQSIPPRHQSPVASGPYFVPRRWVQSIAFRDWSRELPISEILIIGQLFGISDRNTQRVIYNLKELFRNVINTWRRTQMRENGGIATPVSEKTILLEFLNSADEPRRLHDRVKLDFTQRNRPKPTLLMLKAVSQMYGLPSDAPIKDIVRRLRKIFVPQLDPQPLVKHEESEVPETPMPQRRSRVLRQQPPQPERQRVRSQRFRLRPRHPDQLQTAQGPTVPVRSTQPLADNLETRRVNIPQSNVLRIQGPVMPAHLLPTAPQSDSSRSPVRGPASAGSVTMSPVAEPQHRNLRNKPVVSNRIQMLDTASLEAMTCSALQGICKELRIRNNGRRDILIARIKSNLNL